MRLAIVFLLAGALVAAGSLLAGAARAQGVTAIIDGPSAIGVGSAETYNVTGSGGPGASGGAFSVKYWLIGSDLTGGRPTESAPGTASAHNGTRVTLNVTAPTKDQVVTLVVEVNSSKGSAFEVTRVTKSITVVTPVVLSATFRNTSPVAAVNLSVEFSIDGTVVGRTTIRRIEPGGTGVATLSWLPVGLTAGTHAVTAKADLNGDGRIEAELGEAQSSNLFYKTSPELPWGVIVVLVGGILLAGLIANSAIKRRRQQPRT